MPTSNNITPIRHSAERVSTEFKTASGKQISILSGEYLKAEEWLLGGTSRHGALPRVVSVSRGTTSGCELDDGTITWHDRKGSCFVKCSQNNKVFMVLPEGRLRVVKFSLESPKLVALEKPLIPRYIAPQGTIYTPKCPPYLVAVSPEGTFVLSKCLAQVVLE